MAMFKNLERRGEKGQRTERKGYIWIRENDRRDWSQRQNCCQRDIMSAAQRMKWKTKWKRGRVWRRLGLGGAIKFGQGSKVSLIYVHLFVGVCMWEKKAVSLIDAGTAWPFILIVLFCSASSQSRSHVGQVATFFWQEGERVKVRVTKGSLCVCGCTCVCVGDICVLSSLLVLARQK